MTPEEFGVLLVEVVPPLLDEGVSAEVGGSGALLLRGADIEPGDLDLLVPDDNLSSIRTRFPHGSLDTTHTGGWQTAWRYRWGSVEVLGGPALRDRGETWVIPLGAPDLVEVDGVTIPLSPLDVWLRIYRIIRSERLEMARKLV